MKFILSYFFCIFFNGCAYSQHLNNLVFTPTVGFRLFISEYELPHFSQAFDIRASPSIGMEVGYKSKPFALSFYLDRGFYTIYNPEKSALKSNVLHKSRGYLISLLYHKNKHLFGIGHYSQFHESSLNYVGRLPQTKRYITLSYGLRLGKAEIEYVKLFRYYTYFAVRGAYFSSLNIKYHIQNKTTAQQTRDKYAQRFHFKLGVRTFMITNNYLLGEEKRRFGVSGSLGAEYLLPRFHTAAFAERDWWFGLNGGSPERQINGYVSNSILGVRFYYGKKRDWNIALGYAAVTDNNLLPITRPQILAGTAKVRLWYYNVKGVSVGFGKKVSPNCVLDLRGIIPYRGEYKFNKMRYSFGANYLLRV
ncbi:MAG: hypothetical protein RIR11_5179 [Bacteroidota bacterium]|jgi:hypothetical protein